LPEADLAWFANNLKMLPDAATPEITFTPAASNLRPCCEKGLKAAQHQKNRPQIHENEKESS